MKSSVSVVVVIAVLLGGASLGEGQTTYHVNGSCGEDSWSGLSPICEAPDGPKRTIRAGMNAAQQGDTVLVADGRYTGSENKFLSFPGPAFVLRSQNGPRDCTIDCQGSGTAFFFAADEPPDSVVDGFTIVNASDAAFFCHHDNRTTIKNCVVTGNSGGGFWIETTSRTTIIDCTITGNRGISGGGIVIRDAARPTILNCTISGNTADSDGGGVYCDTFGTSPTIAHCAITGNTAGGNGGGVFNGGFGVAALTNCIIWSNAADQVSGPASIRFSDVQGGFDGEGNIDADPMFLDLASGDLRLDCASPCVDAGTNSSSPTLRDFEGDDRIVDGDSDGTPTADMGADEFDMHWRFEGRAVVGGPPVRFRVQAPPAQSGNRATVLVSFGDGTATGGIIVPGTGRRLMLDRDTLFDKWLTKPTAFRQVVLASCPGAATASFTIPPSQPLGLTLFFAGVSRDGSGAYLSVTPTRFIVTE